MGCDLRGSQLSRSISTGSSNLAHGFACRTRERWAGACSGCGSTSIVWPSASLTSSRVSKRTVLLTVFRKQRMNERTQIERARAAMERCAVTVSARRRCVDQEFRDVLAFLSEA